MTKKYAAIKVIYYTWMLLFVLAPLILLLIQSLFNIHGNFSLENYIKYFSNPSYLLMSLNSFFYAFFITLISLLLAYPFAYFLTLKRSKNLLILLVLLPTWINLLLKTYAFIGIFSQQGLVNEILAYLGFESFQILFTDLAFILVAVYIELPFMILPIYQSLEDIPNQYKIASYDLGATNWQSFYRVILPLSMDGVRSGIQAVFIPCLSLFMISRLIGGNRIITLGTAVEQHYLVTQDWGMGSTIGLVLVVLMFLVMFMTRKREKGEG